MYRPLILIPLILLTACLPNRSRTADTLSKGSNDLQKFDNSLKFSNVTLEQADEKGKLWWKVKAAEATYSKDKKTATVEKPEGELYQDGKPIFKIAAAKGEVIQDGKSIMLRGQITATDLKDGTILQGQEIEWKPTEDKLFVRKQFLGHHKQMKISGDEGQFLTRKREAEIKGKVIADILQTAPPEAAKKEEPKKEEIKKEEPNPNASPNSSPSPTPSPIPSLDPNAPRMKMQTTQLKWQLDKQLISADQALQIDRLLNNQTTDRASANKGRYNMKDAIAALNQNAQVFLQTQNTNVKSNELIWNIKTQQVNATQAINIVNETQKVTLNADKGNLSVPDQKATLIGNVRGLSLQNQANVSADNLTWFLASQTFEATGNINYQQTNPPFNLKGTKASGALQTQEVQISGGPEGDDRVITEIIPNLNR